jgi:uncharacterized protein (DUF2236 family)
MTDFFPRGSVIRRVSSEPAIGFGAGRALLLQVAHPVVARGVAEHSRFKTNPFARLRATAEAMYAVVFGSTEVALATGARVRRVHEFVKGPGYRANDVENLLWVHATLCDSAVDAYRRFVGKLSTRDAEAYYEEMKHVGELFGLSACAMPAGLPEFGAYVDNMISTIPVSELSRSLAGDIVNPPLPVAARVSLAPAAAVHRFIAVGTTPRRIRDELGLRWSGREQRVLDEIATALRLATRVTPPALRAAPAVLAGRLILARPAAGSSSALTSPALSGHPTCRCMP